jgi:hypothetical protein
MASLGRPHPDRQRAAGKRRRWTITSAAWLGQGEHFRREIIERTGDRQAADKITDAELLREVMNTVGKPGRLGESIRCVVSSSAEGWDATRSPGRHRTV